MAHDARQQERLVERLNELHKKATCLTSAVVASPVVGAQTSNVKQVSMDVRLGPLVVSPSSQASITGQLFVALKFVPETSGSRARDQLGELQVIIKEARNIAGFESPPLASLAAAAVAGDQAAALLGPQASQVEQTLPSGSLPNPFCKCYLLGSNGRRLAKQKTSHLKRTANPKWDHKCVFSSLKLSSLSCQVLEILMFNRDSILVSNNEFLGGIRLCQNETNGEQISASKPKEQQNQHTEPLCSERECRLWNQMLAKPDIWVYGELKLRHLRPLVAKSELPLTVHSPAATPINPTTNELLPPQAQLKPTQVLAASG